MRSYNKYINYFNTVQNELFNSNDENNVRYIITQLMLFLKNNHLIDKNYLDKNQLFVKCEADKSLIKEQSIDDLLSFLTMIYRIDYIDSNSDAYIIYYNNQMIHEILNNLIIKLKKITEGN
ncbi:hypothetical protein [Acholeplasma granularum]|uniref:hypothetical protein n=1 Tax=Acholeplasma granularum TaxID=264635 RepID=UPI0004B5C41B|nr:hypothetical protein [Acholeplasma granularum]